MVRSGRHSYCCNLKCLTMEQLTCMGDLLRLRHCHLPIILRFTAPCAYSQLVDLKGRRHRAWFPEAREKTIGQTTHTKSASQPWILFQQPTAKANIPQRRLLLNGFVVPTSCGATRYHVCATLTEIELDRYVSGPHPTHLHINACFWFSGKHFSDLHLLSSPRPLVSFHITPKKTTQYQSWILFTWMFHLLCTPVSSNSPQRLGVTNLRCFRRQSRSFLDSDFLLEHPTRPTLRFSRRARLLRT